jgi:PKD repeat protein
MKRVIVVWLACALVMGTTLFTVPARVNAGTPGEGDYGILETEWRKQFEESSLKAISTSAGMTRAEESCNLDVVIGGEEFSPTPPKGLWHSVKADGSYRWLKDTESDEASSSAAIVDINGNGFEEVIGGTTSGKTVEVMNATTGEFIWTFPNPPMSSELLFYEWHSSPAVGELNPDLDGLEIVILHAYTSTIYQFQGPLDGRDDGLHFTEHVGNPDDPLNWWEGVPVGTEGPDWDIIWVADLRTVGGALSLEEADMEFSSPAIADVDADGDLDVLVASRNGYVYVIDGMTGSILSSFPTGATSASVAVANVDDDPQLEVFVGTVESEFYALHWDASRTPPGLELMWTYPLSGYVVYSSAAVGDVDADGSLEVVFGTSVSGSGRGATLLSNGAVFSVDAVSGSMEWTIGTGGGVYSSPALADRSDVTRWEMTWPFFRANVRRTGYLPGSGTELAVYVGSDDSYLYLLRGTDGSLIDRFFVDPTQPIQSSPALGDIDGDFKIEAHVLTLHGTTQLDPAFWSIEDTGSSGSGTTSCGEPVADFGWWPLKPKEGQEIQFTDLSYDTMGEIVEWDWSFNHPGFPGGGPFSSDQNPTHIYGDNGLFDVTLTVWDDEDNSASVTKTVEVINADPTLDVWLSALAGSEQRTHGYWKHQCWIEENNLQSDEHPGISPFIDFIKEHSLVWANTNIQEICTDLRYAGNQQPQKLRRQLIAVWLNVASGKLFLDTPLHHHRTSSDTIGDFLFEAEDAILRALAGEYVRLHQIAVDINEDAGLFRYVPPVSGFYRATATDPGSDDLGFAWDCLDSSPIITGIHYNNGLGPDPYPSPDGTYPFIAEDSVICQYPFPPNTFLPSLTVTDDDGGQAKDEDIVDAWSADYRFAYAMEWIDIGFGFIVVDITVTYLEWDSCVIPIDPFTGEPLFGGGFGGEGRQGGDGISGGGGIGEENGP